MKAKNLIFTLAIAGLLASCSSKVFYQLYKTTYDGLQQTNKALVYEDQYCRILYNFWGEGGKIGFTFYNKSDRSVYLNLDECFFILNGTANDYFKNRTFSSSTGTGVTVTTGTSSTKSYRSASTGVTYYDSLQTNTYYSPRGQSYFYARGIMTSKASSTGLVEQKTACIPSKTSKAFTEYVINTTVYRDCDLFRFPPKREFSTKSFSKSDSPYVFSNRITFTIGKSDSIRQVENEFFVSEITNMTEKDMITKDYLTNCGQTDVVKSKLFNYAAPDRFYLEYGKEEKAFWKH